MENWSYNPRVRKHKHKHKNAMALAHEMNANAGAAAFCCSSESPSAVSSECEAEADISGEGEGNGDDNSRCCSSSSSFSLSTRGRNAGDGDTWLESTSSATSMPWCAFAGGRDTVVWEPSSSSRVSEVDLMKERFSKLLLGEDMSGCGKGVCSALAISNAITNLAASVFGDLWRLEPVAPARKETWKREMEWLLCVSDSIVELVPTWQRDHQGSCMEVMITRPRSDLYLNLPALKKLDAMLLEILDSFSDNEFWYVDRGILLGDVNDDGYVAPRRHVQHHEDKWWLPILKVPANGLSDATRKQLQQHRECASQILKAAMSINTHVLSDMEVPESFVASLPKTGKACLGDVIYRYLTSEQFSPEGLLDCLDLSSEHRILEIANRIEAALRVWKEKATSKRMHNRKSNKARSKSKWGRVKSFVGDFEKRNLLSERAESLLLTLKLRFPGLSQTLLDMNKIQHNKDVGHSILESYSRVLESLAFNISARIDDVLYTDDMAKRCAAGKLSCDASTSFSSNKKAMDATANLTEYVPPLPSTSTSTYATPFATPSFSPAHHQACSETAADALSNLSRSSNTYRRGSKSKDVKDFLGGDFRSAKDSGRVDELMKIHKSVLVELEKVWSYTENIGSRKAPP